MYLVLTPQNLMLSVTHFSAKMPWYTPLMQHVFDFQSKPDYVVNHISIDGSTHQSLSAFRTVNKIHAYHKVMRSLILLHELFASSGNCGVCLKYSSLAHTVLRKKWLEKANTVASGVSWDTHTACHTVFPPSIF
jgi:hypothetical protein